MSRWSNIYKSFLSGALLTLFLGYLCSITLFTHSHIINGVTIVHSHPYSKDHTSKDTAHTDTELQLIESISSYLSGSVDFFISIPKDVYSLKRKINVFLEKTFHFIPIPFDFSLRAPPSINF